MVLELDENTARQLIEAASSEGMTVEEFVRAHLLSNARIAKKSQSYPIIGGMADEANLLDEVVANAYAARERDPLRVDSDG